MTRSANEIEGLARKAALGAGFPAGQAEAFGRAAVLHLAEGGDAQALSDALADPSDSPILRLPLLVEDMLRALMLAGPEIDLTLQPGDERLAPAYARLMPVDLKRIEVATPEEGPARIEIVADPARLVKPQLPPRIAAPDALIRELTRLASRTLVPASEASRAAGAGAGNIDND